VDQGLCTYDSKVCTQGRQTRIIEGVPITRDCWEDTYTYSCVYPAKDDCGPLRARGCAQISSACKQQVGSTCVVYNQTYQCKGSTTTTESITGGKTPFCLDGNCRDQGYAANDEMMSSLAQLTLLKEMQGQIENNFIFKGEDNRCSKCAVSFKDCCGSGKGWGKSIGLTDCSSQERALKKKRDVGLCHYVGTYCAEKIPIIGTCIKKKSTYCCFGSKLLKAFHAQGRPQLRLGWGSAEEPLCRGFTIEEIQRIDFSKLDLREVYEELMKNYSLSKLQRTGEKIGDRLETIKKGLIPNAKQQPKQRPEA
jgi:conjugal transfer mating pair stabilization protein TraN